MHSNPDIQDFSINFRHVLETVIPSLDAEGLFPNLAQHEE